MDKKRVFADANTLISGLLFEGNESMLLELGSFGAVELAATQYVLREVREVLARAEFALSREEVRDLVGYVHQVVVIVDDPSPPTVRECARKLADKKDAPVVAGFLSSKADYLVTGDKELLREVKGAISTSALLRVLLRTSG